MFLGYNRGGVIIFPPVDLALILLMSPLLLRSFLLLWFFSVPFVFSQNISCAVCRDWLQYYWFWVEILFQPPVEACSMEESLAR